jgi:predicted RNase H-like HicB family nuclease
VSRQYVAFIHKEEDSDFGVSFPDFPGCVTAGSTPDEAYGMALEALQFHVDGMLEDGEEISEPTSLTDAYKMLPEVQATAIVLVPAKAPAKAKRINITIDENLLEEIDAEAEDRKTSRSAILAEGARQVLSKRAD